MALRLRRDVQKASYYVWFLGAEEAKGLRGERVINSVLPYLIDRSRGQEPLKVTLQVSHKGIKILQGSSKHFIPHSAITSSVQTDDIVACVLLLYNPATKCPLHVHAYRCDSETTAETLHQQLQILINRPDNQKRFEELETRLGILPQLPTSGNKSTAHSHGKEKAPSNFQSQQKQKHSQPHPHPHQQQRRPDTSPKRFSSSLGSDTGNSTRESECSEENSNASPISRSPPTIVKPSPLPQPTNELFDSLAAELRAKLNGNGPPILLPPRDYDTVHRSKGNLTAIELRRCRNALIVGKANANGKQVSSRGSSGIGSDLAPSPERQELNSSSDDEHWSNEADNSVIALKPSQIAMERSPPTIIPHHPLLNRKIAAVKPPEDSYLRDLPAKPYTPRPHGNGARDARAKPPLDTRDSRSKTPSSNSWSKEDDIKPVIVRPIDYDAKFHRVLQNETGQKANYIRRPETNSKLNDTDKYNEINRLLNKKLIIDNDALEQQPQQPHMPMPMRYNKHKVAAVDEVDVDDYDDSDLPSEKLLMRKENLTDKQKFLEYSSKKQQQQKSYAPEEFPKYGGRHRYVDPADLPFDPPQPSSSSHNKFAAVHRGKGGHSPNRSDLGQRSERHEVAAEPERRRRPSSRDREPETERYARSGERNPYREPESIPYIQSMEKMMKSSAMRYKSYDGMADPKDDKISQQRSKSYPKHEDEIKAAYPPREETRYNESKEKMRPVGRSGSRYDLSNERDPPEYRSKRRGSMEPVDRPQVYHHHQEWSKDERRDDSPAPNHSRTRSRDRWEQDMNEVLPPRQPAPRRDYAREGPSSSKHTVVDHRRDTRDHSPDRYREQRRYDPRPHEREPQRDTHYRMERPRDNSRDYPRDHMRGDYSPDTRSDFRPQYLPEKQHGGGGAAVTGAKSLSNLAKGYRHSYAEPVFARGRVGLAAVNPY